MMMPVGRSLSWDDFESAHLLQFLPFEEAQLGDRTMDIALLDFGEKHVGRTLSALDIHVLWTVFFPWDWEAVLHFSPVDLMWFMLKHITAPGFDQARQHVSPFRMGMAALARTPWDQLAGLRGMGCWLVTIGPLLVRQPMGRGKRSSARSGRRCTPA